MTNSHRSSTLRLSITAARLPGVFRYPAMPVESMYSAYASPSDLRVAPFQIRAINVPPVLDQPLVHCEAVE